ncbi:UNKNOWN [Stylonychia lemnae]|uniref:Uncharacterized protein n=1 Tax=Stylonychia lemnae TaxID=5949 RepID=A0A077ZV07_STYLE|nr:UNKNOWN [Stylonychia lemnae]|eukprot:CDW73424.1 UNKNOWN [Stylonychia lemnae]
MKKERSQKIVQLAKMVAYQSTDCSNQGVKSQSKIATNYGGIPLITKKNASPTLKQASNLRDHTFKLDQTFSDQKILVSDSQTYKPINFQPQMKFSRQNIANIARQEYSVMQTQTQKYMFPQEVDINKSQSQQTLNFTIQLREAKETSEQDCKSVKGGLRNKNYEQITGQMINVTENDFNGTIETSNSQESQIDLKKNINQQKVKKQVKFQDVSQTTSESPGIFQCSPYYKSQVKIKLLDQNKFAHLQRKDYQIFENRLSLQDQKFIPNQKIVS